MTLSSALNRAVYFVPAIALAFSAASADAQSLKVGQCFKATDVKQVMAQDNQKLMAYGAELDGANTARRFWSNKDGTLGYDLKGDLPHGQPQGEYCVKAMMTNVVLLPHSDANSAPPSWLQVKSGDGKTSGSNLVQAYANGVKFVMTAQSVVEKDGKYFPAIRFGITADAAGNASLLSINAGKATSDFRMKGYALTPDGAELLARQHAGQQNVAQSPEQPPVALAAATMPAVDRRP